MKIFNFGDDGSISYTEGDVTKKLDERTIEDLKNLQTNRKDSEYLKSEIERNEKMVSDEKSSTIQKKVAEESIKGLQATASETKQAGNDLVSKIKTGFVRTQNFIGHMTSNQSAVNMESEDPTLQLFCSLLSSDESKPYIDKSLPQKGVAVPDDKTDKFIEDLSDIIDLPNEEKARALENKGYELARTDHSRQDVALNDDQALVIVSTDKDGNQNIIAFDNPKDAMDKKDQKEFRETFLSDEVETTAFSVSRKEFLSKAMKIYASADKRSMVQKLDGTKLIYSKPAFTQSKGLPKQEQKAIQEPSVQKQQEFNFNTRDYKDCAIKIDSVNWEQFRQLGITPEELHKKGQLKSLLNGEKTDLLMIRTLNKDGVMMSGNFKFQLTVDKPDKPQLMMSGVRSKLYIPDNFHGVELSDKDKQLLKEKGTLYRDVIINGEKRLLYIDKQTNEICTRKVQDINIPDRLRGKELTEREKADIKSGKPVHLTNLVSKEGKTYSAWVYLNPMKNTLKYDFNSPLEAKSQEIKTDTKNQGNKTERKRNGLSL